jgi:hypothetical protein
MDYRCDAGHDITTAGDRVIDRCLAASCPSPRLSAWGDGSRLENARLRVIYAEDDLEEAKRGQLDL